MLLWEKSLFFRHFSFCFLLSVLRRVHHSLTRSGPDPYRVERGELPSCGDPRRFFETTVLSWDANVARIWVHIVNRAVHTVCSLVSRKCRWARIQQHLITSITLTSLDLYLWGLELLIMWDWRWWYTDHNLQIGRCSCCWQLQLI